MLRLLLPLLLATGCQPGRTIVVAEAPPNVTWLIAVLQSGDGSAVAASALTPRGTNIEIEDLPAPKLTLLGYTDAQIASLGTCKVFRPARSDEPILGRAEWIVAGDRPDGTFDVEPSGLMPEVTADCLPRCPETIAYDFSCESSDLSCRARAEQRGCEVTVKLDGKCSAEARLSVDGRGALTVVAGCAPRAPSVDASVSLACAPDCDLSIYPRAPPRIEIKAVSSPSYRGYAAVAIVSGQALFSRPHQPGADRCAPDTSKFFFVELELLGISKTRPAPRCAEHLLATEDGRDFFVLHGPEAAVSRYDGDGMRVEDRPLSAGATEGVAMAVAGDRLFVAARTSTLGLGLVEIRDPRSLELRSAIRIAGEPVAVAASTDEGFVLDASGHLHVIDPVAGTAGSPIKTGTSSGAGQLLYDGTLLVSQADALQRFGGRPLAAIGPPRRPYAFQGTRSTALALTPDGAVIAAIDATLAVLDDGQIRNGALTLEAAPIIGGAVDAQGRAWFILPNAEKIVRAKVIP